MAVFKYKRIRHKIELDEARLNEFGRRGWELISVCADDYGYTYFFKVHNSNSEKIYQN